MGYTTDFDGSIAIEPPLNEHEISFLLDFNGSRRMLRTKGPLHADPGADFGQARSADIQDYNRPPEGQPGLWCQWVPTEDGGAIEWDGGEKFYDSPTWMSYLIDQLLSPAARAFIEEHQSEDERLRHFTCDHVLNGTINAQGEDPGDRWRLVVTDNAVQVHDGSFIFESEAGLVFNRTQVESWVGHALTDEQIAQLQEALPRSTFPDTVEAVAHEALGFDDIRDV